MRRRATPRDGVGREQNSIDWRGRTGSDGSIAAWTKASPISPGPPATTTSGVAARSERCVRTDHDEKLINRQRLPRQHRGFDR